MVKISSKLDDFFFSVKNHTRGSHVVLKSPIGANVNFIEASMGERIGLTRCHWERLGCHWERLGVSRVPLGVVRVPLGIVRGVQCATGSG